MQRDAAPGIHRVEDAFTNWYLVEADGAVTVVDAGVPTSWASLQRAMGELGRTLGDVAAVVLTHAHFDHMGFAERARLELGVPVWVHTNDVPLAGHPLQYAHERSPLRYLSRPGFRRVLAAFLRTRAFFPRPLHDMRRFHDGDLLDVPGAPCAVFTPGHTLGHCALHFPDRGAVIAGDSIVTLNPYTGGTGPQIVAGAATADSVRALESLDRLRELEAGVLLPGHGEPWTGGLDAAVEAARAAGPT